MKYSSIPSAQSIVFHCKARGIEHIVISPGSRNAPLTLSFSEDPYFSCFSIVDERSAAFFALGMAQQLQKPVVLVCTSGSALLNYYPAIAEAFYSDISLVVLSADRPPHKIDIGDGQTIRQDHVFERHIGFSTNLKLDIRRAIEGQFHNSEKSKAEISKNESQISIQEFNDTEINTALTYALQHQVPVHINIPFEEPLYEFTDKPTVTPFVCVTDELNELEDLELEEFTSSWNNAKRKMILVGVNAPNTIEQQFLDELAEDESVIVFTETTSNLHHPNFFAQIDGLIAPIEKSEKREFLFQELQPDILLTFGGLIVSKKIKFFLRKYAPKQHWHIDKKKAYDTFFCLTKHFKTDVNNFFNQFLEKTKTVDSNYNSFWNKIKSRRDLMRKEYLENVPFCDMQAFDLILQHIPNEQHIQVANSSAIRYMQLFPSAVGFRVFCNRGTSGIDGSTSTAVGASIFASEATTLITGDLSFFYDSNGLWNNYLRPDLRIILINNNGGGIFRILPGTEKSDQFETYFETTHGLSAVHLCAMHNINYAIADDEESLKNALTYFFEASENPKLLEIQTPRLLNDKILLAYFDFLS